MYKKVVSLQTLSNICTSLEIVNLFNITGSLHVCDCHFIKVRSGKDLLRIDFISLYISVLFIAGNPVLTITNTIKIVVITIIICFTANNNIISEWQLMNKS